MPAWPRGLRPQAGSWPGALGFRPRRIPSPGLLTYDVRHRGPIRADGTGQATVSGSGAATVQVGPAGYGTTWYPVQAAITTTSGPNDSSTCQLFVGAQTPANLIGGQSYAGGGDTIGMAGMMLQQGEFITAVWSGGKSGDTATLRVSGDESTLA